MKKYLAVIDFDSAIVRAATLMQNDLKVCCAESGEYLGHYSSQKEAICSLYKTKEGLTFDKTDPKLVELDEGDEWTHQQKANYVASKALKPIINQPWVEDYRIVIGGEGNYRKEAAHTWKYKGERTTPILLREATMQYIKDVYGDKVVVANGMEADDVVSIYLYQDYLQAKASGSKKDAKVVLVAIDKDLQNTPGFHTNYEADEVYWVSDEDAWTHFFTQMLTGDRRVDNIPGLLKVNEPLKEQWPDLRRGGLGAAGAAVILLDCDTPLEQFNAVTKAYSLYWGDEPKEWKSWRGEELEWTWEDYFKEQAALLWMQRSYGDRFPFDEWMEEVYG